MDEISQGPGLLPTGRRSGSHTAEDAASGAVLKTVDHACCPHVDHNDARCGHRFSLGRIEQAFQVCFGAYHGCPLYHRINDEAARSTQVPVISITLNANHLPLRATGT